MSLIFSFCLIVCAILIGQVILKQTPSGVSMLLGKDSDNMFVFLFFLISSFYSSCRTIEFFLVFFVGIGCFDFSRQGSSVLGF